MKKFFTDFKAFIAKGNILDMAVGVIIGGAFSPIITSLVNDIIMPPLGMLVSGNDLSEMKIILREATETDAAISINYGTFISTVLNFLLIALVIFSVLRAIMKGREKLEQLTKKKEDEAPSEPETPEEPVETEEDILRDIRDLLKDKDARE